MNRKNQAIEYKPSETAGFTTYFRACSNKEKERQIRGPDYLAKIFHVGSAKWKLKMSRILLPILKRYLPGTYEWVAARTFMLDDIFKKALIDNWDQIIILGAGFDSRSYRFKDLIKDTKLFEIDLPTTQTMKKFILDKIEIEIPEHLHFIPINLNKENLDQLITGGDFKPKAKNLFIWEGVTEYLTEESVDDTLSFIRKNSLPSSQLAFTYIYKEILEGNFKYYGSREIVKMVSKFGEPYQFGIYEGKIEQFLRERGFKLVKNYSAEELEEKYFLDDKGKSHGKINGNNAIALAEVI